jgi:hypothetical protein
MIQTISYGQKHEFYSQGMARLVGAPSAQSMYAGAAIWLVVVVVASVLILQATLNPPTIVAGPTSQARRSSSPTIMSDCMNVFNGYSLRLEQELTHRWIIESRDLEGKPLLARGVDQPYANAAYGTIPSEDRDKCNARSEGVTARLTLVALISMFLLWIAQWMFWAGFINLSFEEYVQQHKDVALVKTNPVKLLSSLS